MESQEITLARAAYARYGATTDYKNFLGLPMPTWEELPEKIREAWVAAVTVPAEEKPAVYSQYQAHDAKPTSVQAAILQCCSLRWDGDVESKRDRSNAAELGYIARYNGFNIVTEKGIKYLFDQKLIRP